MHYNDNINEILNEGYACLEKGDIKKAQQTYMEGLVHNPDNISLINNLAQCYAMTGNVKESRKYHQKLIELCDNDNTEMLMLKGNSLLAINNLSEALECFEVVLSRDPFHEQALFQIATIYAEKEEYSKSNKYLSRILDENPKDIAALMNKGLNFSEMECFDKALECCNNVLSLYPKNEDAIRLKGKLLKQKGNRKELSSYIRNTLKIKPDSPYTLMLKAMEYESEDNEQMALEFYNRAIEVDPMLDEAYFNKASLLMLKKNYDEAIDCYRQAFEINPESGGIVDKEGLFELLNQMKNAVKK